MKYLFITGMGRSGTKFLGTLLASAPDAEAHHEYLGNREFWLLSWYLDSADYALPFLKRSRAAIEADRDSRVGCFIDVNSYLANAAGALREVFDEAPVYHLVRDPRKVIPSIYARRNDHNVHLLPRRRPEVEWWLGADKFEQICWNWANTTHRLHEQGTTLLQFERVVDDYDYFERTFCAPCGLTVTRAVWEAAKAVKVNRTRSRLYRYLFARMKGKPFVTEEMQGYAQWSDRQRQQFERICGSAMREVGYAT